MSPAAATEQKKQEHNALEPFEMNGQWTTPCSCGRRFTAPSPAGANARWRKHLPQQPQVRTAPTADRIRTCGCDCGGQLSPKAGGVFLSGHDARFKSVLTRAHAASEQVRHPQTGEMADALVVADWLDERRGGGSFWHDKVLKGLRAAAAPQPRQSRQDRADAPLTGAARAEHLIQALAARRPAAGQEGVYISRDGKSQHPAKVVRRNDETTLVVKVLGGNLRGQEIIVPDSRFQKGH